MNRKFETSETPRPKRRGFRLATAVAAAAIAGGILVPTSSAMAAPTMSVESVVSHNKHDHKKHDGNHHGKKKKKHNQGNTQGGTQGGGNGNTQGGTQGGGNGNTQGGTQG
ncbi:hypothetical protein, partial [Streptomyces sp. IGB124]|uniref:hypothetical protein n=1 Tax=Streptomyces sp. IGB124 TaxID=1519485 RepID=UPI0006BFF298